MQEPQGQQLGAGTARVAGGPASAESGRAATGARHRQHVFPGRGNVVKVLYSDDERSIVVQAAELTGLRTSGFVAAAALLFAQGLLHGAEGPVASGAGEQSMSAEPPVLAGRPVVVAWSAGADQALLEELMRARLALRRYGVNVNQAVAALNSGGEVPVWLEQAVAGSERAVARVDEATAALTRRLV